MRPAISRGRFSFLLNPNLSLALKQFVVSFCLILLSLTAFTQEPLMQGWQVQQWYQQMDQVRQAAPVDRNEVLNPRHTDIPDNMMEILQANDWLDYGNYWTVDGSFSRYFGENNHQYEFDRYDAAGRRHRYRLYRAYRNHPAELACRGGAGCDPPEQVFLKVYQGHTYLAIGCAGCADNYYMPIVSYHDGVLIFDVNFSGTLGDLHNKRAFRYVFVALPKLQGLPALVAAN